MVPQPAPPCVAVGRPTRQVTDLPHDRPIQASPPNQKMRAAEVGGSAGSTPSRRHRMLCTRSASRCDLLLMSGPRGFTRRGRLEHHRRGSQDVPGSARDSCRGSEPSRLSVRLGSLLAPACRGPVNEARSTGAPGSPAATLQTPLQYGSTDSPPEDPSQKSAQPSQFPRLLVRVGPTGPGTCIQHERVSCRPRTRY